MPYINLLKKLNRKNEKQLTNLGDEIRKWYIKFFGKIILVNLPLS